MVGQEQNRLCSVGWREHSNQPTDLLSDDSHPDSQDDGGERITLHMDGMACIECILISLDGMMCREWGG
jgi:hypothetical protein